jgi:membrane peptidoglycan carboxypeptidase
MKKKKITPPSFVEHKSRSFGGVLGALAGIIGLSVLAGSLVATSIVPILAVGSTSTTNVIGVFEDLPSELELGELMEKTNIFAKDAAGNDYLLASFFDQNREEVAWDVISTYVKDATVAAEDPRFYEHGGIDIKGTGRALVSNVFGNSLQGGSSITQQYVKNVLVQEAEAITDATAREAAYEEATETSFNRKLKEMKYAISLEKKYTKDEILLGYLNIVGFGGQIYGIEAASKYYFNTTAANLTINQAATLIAIVNNPNTLRVDQPDNVDNGVANGYALTKGRRDYVLSSMLEHKKITREEYTSAKESPIEPTITNTVTGCDNAGGAGYFCDYVTWVVKNDSTFGETEADRLATLRQGGLQIYTTLDMELQKASEDAINASVPKSMANVNIGSTAVSVQPGTGKILAMAQNKDFSSNPDVLAQGSNWTSVNYNTNKNYGGSSGFQPGSTYKVFTLLEWLNTGHRLSETVSGTKNYSRFTNSCEGDWSGSLVMNNDAGGSAGPITPLASTIGSVNTGFMSMAQKLDLCGIRDMASAFGVSRADGDTLQSNPNSVIGTNEVSGLSMATAFAGIANGGVVCTPIAIDRITDKLGNPLPTPTSTCNQAVEPGVAGAAAYALQQVMTKGTGSTSNINDGVPKLGKTGTTDNAVHTWMTGSTTSVATAVWVGNVSGKASMRSTYIGGVQAATIRHKIWPRIMSVADNKYGGSAFSAPDSSLF